MFGFGLVLMFFETPFGDHISQTYAGAGICAIVSSIWIFITGHLGIFSYKLPTSQPRIGTYMGFSIASTLVGIANIALYSLDAA